VCQAFGCEWQQLRTEIYRLGRFALNFNRNSCDRKAIAIRQMRRRDRAGYITRDGSGIHAQDPIVLQCNVEQLDATGPAELPILQFPSTASSGRRLIAITFGGS
jgi:hypothetical protein